MFQVIVAFIFIQKSNLLHVQLTYFQFGRNTSLFRTFLDMFMEHNIPLGYEATNVF